MKKQKIKKTLKHLTISRKKWGRKFLLNVDNGKMCCLGFACIAVGYTDEDIGGRAMPKDAESISSFRGPEWMVRSDARVAAEANDRLKGEAREIEVRRIFAKHGCKIRFVK